MTGVPTVMVGTIEQGDIAMKALTVMGVVGALFAFNTSQTNAADTSRAAPLLNPGQQWREIKVPNRKATRFQFAAPDAIKISSNKSVSFLLHKVMQLPSGQYPKVLDTISWRWRVDGDVVPTDLARKGGDDRPVAIHLFFGKPKVSGGFLSKLIGSFPPAGHALTYVWGGKRPAESIVDNPYFKNGKILIVHNADEQASKWESERRNLKADLRRAFGSTKHLGKLIYIAVSGDSDDTRSRSRALISKLRVLRTGS